MIAPFILAGVNKDNALRELIPTHSTTFDTIAIFGSLFLVTLVVFSWAILSRPRPHRRYTHHYRSSPASRLVSEEANSKQFFGQPRRQDHRPREHFPRNPTLAEIGGLPPLFHEKPPLPPV